MLKIFSSTTKDQRIKELESEVERLKRRLGKQEAKVMRFSFFVEEFKKFSPRLWFEYFSPDAGKCSASQRSEQHINEHRPEMVAARYGNHGN